MSACAKTPWGDMPLSDSRTMPVERAPHGVDDDALRVAGVVFPAPGEGGSRPSSGAAYSVLTVALPDSALVLLRLIGAHDGVEDEGAIITRLVVARAEKIGIAALADAGNCVGRAEAARRSHKPEVPGSNPGPATSIHPESEEGREGVPSGAFPLPQGPP